MGGGESRGRGKKFSWKHFRVYLTIVPPTKASQISPLITSKPARVLCCDLTASQMLQRMQQWAVDIYFQFHMDFHHGGLGSCAHGCQAQLSAGRSKGLAENKKKWEPWELVTGMQAWLKSCHIMKRTSTILPSTFLLLLSLTHIQVHLSSGYVICSVPTSEIYEVTLFFYLKGTFS